MAAKIHEKKLLYRGRVFDFTLERITLENDETIDLEVIRHPGAAAIVAMPDSETILLLHQYRHAVGGYIWEVPAGTVDGGETPERCARRELIEETGFSGRSFEKLGEITPVPGYSDERIHLFLATGLDQETQRLDRDELIRVEAVSLKSALSMIDEGRVQDAKTIVSLILTARRLGVDIRGGAVPDNP
ncbi:MAG: NUDIX hydrolase [Desulfobacterales bacterium]|nr:NUDIX hydrolase [Desulfobacterales bacterium]MCF8079796.1 NUDIX hydrolase [Desulfobacterales bacterium]